MPIIIECQNCGEEIKVVLVIQNYRRPQICPKCRVKFGNAFDVQIEPYARIKGGILAR